MRDRESVDIERKNVIRNLEKQAKVIERLADSEKNLQQQIVRCFVRFGYPQYLTVVVLRQGQLETVNQRLHRMVDEAETRIDALDANAVMYKKQAESTDEMMMNVRFDNCMVSSISLTFNTRRFENSPTTNTATSTASRGVYSKGR